MKIPEVDHELERLFAVAREASLPDSDARGRVRAGLEMRLASGAPARQRLGAWRPWLGLGLVGLGVAAIVLWPRAMPPNTPAVPAAATATPLVEQPPPASTAPVAMASESGVAQPAPVDAPAPAAKPAQRAPGPSGAAASPPHDDDSTAELTLVRAMQRALRAGDATTALSLASEHAQHFPRGTLAEEREGVRAVAQCQLAAPAARPAILSGFIRRFAASPYVPRVKAACQ